MGRSENNEEYRKSRSQKKRESTALQKEGEELAALSPAALATLGLPPDLLEALLEWQGLKNHEAARRQMQYVGRLMRELADTPEMRSALEALDDLRLARQTRSRLHSRLEALRDGLLAPAEEDRERALAEALALFPALETGRLRHLAEAARADKAAGRPPRHARMLFRCLREAEEGAEDQD